MVTPPNIGLGYTKLEHGRWDSNPLIPFSEKDAHSDGHDGIRTRDTSER
jgi:hypothetical protein